MFAPYYKPSNFLPTEIQEMLKYCGGCHDIDTFLFEHGTVNVSNDVPQREI